jgi:hypothetical protein
MSWRDRRRQPRATERARRKAGGAFFLDRPITRPRPSGLEIITEADKPPPVAPWTPNRPGEGNSSSRRVRQPSDTRVGVLAAAFGRDPQKAIRRFAALTPRFSRPDGYQGARSFI